MIKHYSPKIESLILKAWETKKIELRNHIPLYSTLMPPPNITNILHLGHALNNTIQDVLIRFAQLQGHQTLWKIGTDHAGIATENVVDRQLKKEGKSKTTISKQEFLEHILQWKDQFGNKILNQLKVLGLEADWNDVHFTLSPMMVQQVQKAFVDLYHQGLIYRGNYSTDWCVHCLTALSEEEVEFKEAQNQLYYLRYFLEDRQDFLEIATTRPETIPVDIAVAVHPEDTRYQSFIGKKVWVPGEDRLIPIIADDYVDREFGSGVLKITPAHDKNDFEIAKKHQLSFSSILDKKGKINALGKELEGLDRFEARKKILDRFIDSPVWIKNEPYVNRVGCCYRCHQVVEARVSTQWFVKMQPLAVEAMQVVKDKKIHFYPEKWEKIYFHWMENIKDWCISRQITWGHSIPAFHCQNCNHIQVSLNPPTQCSQCQGAMKQDTDVLDTWFSSWLWPFSVLHGDIKLINQILPFSVLVTGGEIIFFWVARMIMSSLHFHHRIPFKEIFFNATICDMQGRKMSKSLGNGIDPLEIIQEKGADALRFTLLYLAPKGERIRIKKELFDLGSKVSNKLWNAYRFISSLGEPKTHLFDPQTPFDFIILDRLKTVQNQVQNWLKQYHFHGLTEEIYHFFWNYFCDEYLEIQKTLFKMEHQSFKNITDSRDFKQHIIDNLYFIYTEILFLFHPVMPFVTEFLWREMHPDTFILDFSPQKLPILNKSSIKETQLIYSMFIEIISSIRKGSLEFSIKNLNVKAIINVAIKNSSWVQDLSQIIMQFLNLSSFEWINASEIPRYKISFFGRTASTFIITNQSFLDLERPKFKIIYQKTQQEIQKIEQKLNYTPFMQKASEKEIQKNKTQLKNLMQYLERIHEVLNG